MADPKIKATVTTCDVQRIYCPDCDLELRASPGEVYDTAPPMIIWQYECYGCDYKTTDTKRYPRAVFRTGLKEGLVIELGKMEEL